MSKTQASYRNEESEGKLVIYRGYFKKLLETSKPLRDQLLIELPVYAGIRTGEIRTLQWEDIDFEHGILRVLDSKAHKIRLVPLHPILAKHFMEYMREKGASQGYVFSRPPGSVGRPNKNDVGTKGVLSKTFINYVWHGWCYASGIPDMSPRWGRAYFACVWIFGDEHGNHKKSVESLKAILGHDEISSTEHYLDRLVSFEDVFREFYEGLELPFVAECKRYELCPNACPNCLCSAKIPNVKTQEENVIEARQV